MQAVHTDTHINPCIHMHTYEQNYMEYLLNFVEEAAVHLQLSKSPAVPSV